MPRMIPLPSADELGRAPERTALTALDASAELAVLALVAAYPELQCVEEAEHLPCEVHAALAVIDAARDLSARLHRYQIALLRMHEQSLVLHF
jgi:hypothetical protein